MADRTFQPFGLPKRREFKRSYQVFGSVTAQCDCGDTTPLVIPFVPGAVGAGAMCKCGATWTIRELTYMAGLDGKPAELNVGFDKAMPSIIRPPDAFSRQ